MKKNTTFPVHHYFELDSCAAVAGYDECFGDAGFYSEY